MSEGKKRTLRDYRSGNKPLRITRKPKRQVLPEVEPFDAEATLTQLGEDLAEAEAEDDRVESDDAALSTEPPAMPGNKYADEAPPVSHSGGSID